MTSSTASCSLTELASLEAARRATLAQTADVTQAQAEYKPANGGWSIGENMDHLVLIHLMYEKQIKAVMELADKGERPVRYLGFDDLDVGFNFVPKAMLPILAAPFAVMNLFVPAKLREAVIRNPIVPSTHPKEATPRVRPLGEIRVDLEAVMKGTRELFNQRSGMDFSKMHVLHPLFGDNTVPGLLSICAAHEGRHQTQMARIMNEPGFPR